MISFICETKTKQKTTDKQNKTKLKQTHRYRKQISGVRGEGVGRDEQNGQDQLNGDGWQLELW